MAALNLSEVTRKLVINQVKTHIKDALDSVRGDRADAKVSTEPPKQYLSYAPAQALQVPLVCFIVEDIDTRKRQKGANFLSAVVYMNVAVIIEEREKELLIIKSERYQAALQDVLDEKILVDDDDNLKIAILVTGASFSGLYQPDQSQPSGTFRREVILNLEIEHYEKTNVT